MNKLILSYIILGISIILRQINLISFEWLFLIYFIVFLLFLVNKIDARYFIFNAILLLWLAPFLLVYKLDAEPAAIYAYYFLIIGVILQIIEFKINYKVNQNFSKLQISRGFSLIQCLIWIIVFIVSNIMHLRSIIKSFSLYLFSIFFILYLIKSLIYFSKIKQEAYHFY